jgi:hypothetical protein
MTVSLRLFPLAVLAACGRSPATEAAPAPKPAPTSPPETAPARTTVPSTGHPDVRADVRVLSVKSTSGGAVVAIGHPPLHLGDDSSLGGLELSARGGIVAAEDSGWIDLWELASGAIAGRIEPLDESPAAWAPTLALSPDATWLAVGSTNKARILKQPYDKVDFTTPCSEVRAFSHDSKLLECHQRLPEIWNVAEHKLVAKAPEGSLVRMPHATQFSADNRALFWTTDHEIVRWDFATSGAVTTVYKTDNEIAFTSFAGGGAHAFVSTHPPKTYKRPAFLVDLTTGKASPLPDGYHGAVSPSGTRVAVFGVGEVRVIDVASNKVVWSVKYGQPPQRIAFAGDDDLLGYVESGRTHVVDLARGERRYDAPSRFAGWIAEGQVAIERGGVLEQLALAGSTWSPADRAALAAIDVHAPQAMPAWATWLTAAPTGGVVAAEANARHELAPAARADAPCDPKVRVWTAKGGEKTLKITCSKVEGRVDPGWELGGGWVAGVTNAVATLFDPSTGKSVAALAVESRSADPKLAHEWVAMALSPAGNAVALISRGPQMPPQSTGDPHEDAMHASERGPHCVVDLSGACRSEYMLTAYSLGGSPKQVVQARLDNGRGAELAPQASGAITFDHAGKRLLVGMNDGAIAIVQVASGASEGAGKGAGKIERLHHTRIARMVVSPGDGWVMSEDAAGEQRIWKLP